MPDPPLPFPVQRSGSESFSGSSGKRPLGMSPSSAYQPLGIRRSGKDLHTSDVTDRGLWVPPHQVGVEEPGEDQPQGWYWVLNVVVEEVTHVKHI